VTDKLWGRLTLATIAVAALAISSGTTVDLMLRLNWTLWQALLVPITIDVLAGYGVAQWLSSKRSSDSARLGRRVAIACLVVSIAGNAIEHVLASPQGYWWASLSLVWGSLPPVAFFVAVHMYARAIGTVTTKRRMPVAARVEPLHSVPVPRNGVTDDAILAWVRNQSGSVTKRQVMAEFRIGSARALRLLKAA
jgi:hypothetical protein